MGQNSTEVAYGFGQMGSAFLDAVETKLYAPQGKVIVAITCTVDIKFESLTAETRSIPGSGTSHAHQYPEYFGLAAAAHDLGDCVIAGASKIGNITTVTHTANTAGPGSTSAIKVGMQLASLGDLDFPRDGLLGRPVMIEEILSSTTFRVSDNARAAVLSSQSLAGLALNSSGHGGVAVDAANVFPKGITVYGRWTDLSIATIGGSGHPAGGGGIIVYFGH